MFLGVIVGIVLLVWVYRLNARVDILSREVNELKGGKSFLATGVAPIHGNSVSQAPVYDTTASVPTSVLQQRAATATYVATPAVEEPFVTWIKQDFFVKLGALLLLIGFGWFVSYAFAHNWIGEVGRISLGLVTGVAIMAFGVWRIRNYTHQGSIFLVLGSTTVLLTIYAARGIYDFFTPETALGLMFLSVLFVAFVSVKYKNENLAIASLLLAAIAPVLTDAPAPNITGLFSYLLVIVLGTLWVVRLTGSRKLTFTALIVVILYGLPFMSFGNSGDKDIALLFSFIFTAVFFTGNVISMIRQRGGEIYQAHFMTAFGTGIYLAAWIFVAAPKEFQSLLFAAWMCVFALGTFVVYRFSQNRIPFYIYGAISIGLLGAATAAELQGPALTIAFTIETGVILLLTRFLTRDVRMVQNMSWLFLVPVILSLQSLVSPAWSGGFLHGDFFVLLVLAVAFLAASVSLINRNEAGEESSMPFALTLGVAGVLYILFIIWLVFHSLFAQDTATMFSLVTYSLIGFGLFINGRMQNEKITRTSGAVLLGFVVAHLLLVDLINMDLVGRIITFFAIGSLLISTAFIGQKKKLTENLRENA